MPFIKVTSPKDLPALMRSIANSYKEINQRLAEQNYGSVVLNTTEARNFTEVQDKMKELKAQKEFVKEASKDTAEKLADAEAAKAAAAAKLAASDAEQQRLADKIGLKIPGAAAPSSSATPSAPAGSSSSSSSSSAPTGKSATDMYEDLLAYAGVLKTNIDDTLSSILINKQGDFKLYKENVTYDDADRTITLGSDKSSPITSGTAKLLTSKKDDIVTYITKKDITAADMAHYVRILIQAKLIDDKGKVLATGSNTGGPKIQVLVKPILFDSATNKNYNDQFNVAVRAAMSKVGFGLKVSKKRKYQSRLAKNSDRFGKLIIDRAHLAGGSLTARDAETNEIKIKMPVSEGLVYLLTHNTHSSQAGKKYTKEDLLNYHKLIEQAGLSIPSHNRKNALLKEGSSVYFIDRSKPEEIIDRLTILTGEIKAGNNSKDVHNQAVSLADIALKEGLLSKVQHKNILKEL